MQQRHYHALSSEDDVEPRQLSSFDVEEGQQTSENENSVLARILRWKGRAREIIEVAIIVGVVVTIVSALLILPKVERQIEDAYDQTEQLEVLLDNFRAELANTTESQRDVLQSLKTLQDSGTTIDKLTQKVIEANSTLDELAAVQAVAEQRMNSTLQQLADEKASLKDEIKEIAENHFDTQFSVLQKNMTSQIDQLAAVVNLLQQNLTETIRFQLSATNPLAAAVIYNTPMVFGSPCVYEGLDSTTFTHTLLCKFFNDTNPYALREASLVNATAKLTINTTHTCMTPTQDSYEFNNTCGGFWSTFYSKSPCVVHKNLASVSFLPVCNPTILNKFIIIPLRYHNIALGALGADSQCSHFEPPNRPHADHYYDEIVTCSKFAEESDYFNPYELCMPGQPSGEPPIAFADALRPNVISIHLTLF